MALNQLNNSPNNTSKEEHFESEEIIGLSEHCRPLIVRFFGGKGPQRRVFVVAGQHGDERYGRKAVRKFLRPFLEPGSFESNYRRIQLAVLTNANPDGAAKRTRNNASDIDLNRDHLLLASKENQAIHRFVQSWKPHVIIDVHNFPSRRKHLLLNDRIIYYDVFIDFPTNPAIQLGLEKNEMARMIQQVKMDLSKQGFSCERYTIIKPSGRARHSTPDINDARNFFALRHSALTILLEGRSPTRREGRSERNHIGRAQQTALVSVLNQIERRNILSDRGYQSYKGKIPIKFKYTHSREPLRMIFKNPRTKSLDSVAIPEYAADLRVTQFIYAPLAYALPIGTSTIEILLKHGFTFVRSDKMENIEYYVYAENKLNIRTGKRLLDKYLIFPMDQSGGQALPLMLEPASKYGLFRYHHLGLNGARDSVSGVLRVVTDNGLTM
jgi:Succinylglutamate desuccinylase / Aspartoacylase family